MKDWIKQILRENLEEAKQVGIVYHFTSFENLFKIIQSDFVLKSDITPFVSFTRNKLMSSSTISRDVRITIDGDLLSNIYRIQPHADRKAGFGRGSEDESEERISLSKFPNGINVKKYIKSIDLYQPKIKIDFDDEESFGPTSLLAFQSVINLLKKKGIPFNVQK